MSAFDPFRSLAKGLRMSRYGARFAPLALATRRALETMVADDNQTTRHGDPVDRRHVFGVFAYSAWRELVIPTVGRKRAEGVLIAFVFAAVLAAIVRAIVQL